MERQTLNPVAESLGQFIGAFRIFARPMPEHEIANLPGLAVSWAGIPNSFFNAIFLTNPVETLDDLDRRFATAANWMEERPQQGMIVTCTDWIEDSLRRETPGVAAAHGLVPGTYLTGMAADTIAPAAGPVPLVEFRHVEDAATARAISDLNCLAYGSPVELGRGSMDNPALWNLAFGDLVCIGGEPVSAAGTFPVINRLYLSWVATLPHMRNRGLAEAAVRHSLQRAMRATGLRRTILHATAHGFPVYRRMGFTATSRFVTWVPET